MSDDEEVVDPVHNNDIQKRKEKIRKELIPFFYSTPILKKIIANHINNRVQEFPDPITSTLVTMVNSPMQVTFCESGILIFKTTNLPILPYETLNNEEMEFLSNTLSEFDNSSITETYHGCGKFSVQINLGPGHYMPKKNVLLGFVDIMLKQKDFKEKCILQRLSDIILQRFLSNVSMHSEDITLIMEKIWKVEALPTATDMLIA